MSGENGRVYGNPSFERVNGIPGDKDEKEQLPPYRVCRKDNGSFSESLHVPECLQCFNRFRNDAQKHGIVVNPITVTHDIHNNAF